MISLGLMNTMDRQRNRFVCTENRLLAMGISIQLFKQTPIASFTSLPTQHLDELQLSIYVLEALSKVDVGLAPVSVGGLEGSTENGDGSTTLNGEADVLSALGEVWIVCQYRNRNVGNWLSLTLSVPLEVT
jgi:hypothetical protein